MMNVNEIQQRFNHIENTISQAAEMCLSDASVPKELKDWVEKMDMESDQVKQILQTKDEDRILQCVDDLEEIGDHAKDACQRASNVKDSVRQAVLLAHRELSDLKHQLH